MNSCGLVCLYVFLNHNTYIRLYTSLRQPFFETFTRLSLKLFKIMLIFQHFIFLSFLNFSQENRFVLCIFMLLYCIFAFLYAFSIHFAQLHSHFRVNSLLFLRNGLRISLRISFAHIYSCSIIHFNEVTAR